MCPDINYQSSEITENMATTRRTIVMYDPLRDKGTPYPGRIYAAFLPD